MNTWVMAERIFFSLVLGAIVGWEREEYGKPAGLRTLTLVCVGSTLFMVLTMQLTTVPNAPQTGTRSASSLPSFRALVFWARAR